MGKLSRTLVFQNATCLLQDKETTFLASHPTGLNPRQRHTMRKSQISQGICSNMYSYNVLLKNNEQGDPRFLLGKYIIRVWAET
jgi:hypothetical protein